MVKNDLIRNILTVLRQGYEYYSLEQAQHSVQGVGPVTLGTGFKNKDRFVYVVKKLVYKIWKPSYKGSNKLLAAIESGFYDKNIVPALIGVILDNNGVCCGYVMRKCKLHVRGDEFKTLFNRVCENSKEYRFIYTDLLLENTGICPQSGEPTLLDLESVAKLGKKKISTCRDFSYKKFLKTLTFPSDSV